MKSGDIWQSTQDGARVGEVGRQAGVEESRNHTRVTDEREVGV